MIGGTTKNERNLPRVVGRQALGGQIGGVVEPVGDILIGAAAAGGGHTRRHLQAVGLVRRSFQYPAQTVGESQAGRHVPGILAKELIVIDGVTALDGGALGQGSADAIEVVDAVPLGENTHHDSSRAVIVRAEVAVHSGKSIVGRV